MPNNQLSLARAYSRIMGKPLPEEETDKLYQPILDVWNVLRAPQLEDVKSGNATFEEFVMGLIPGTSLGIKERSLVPKFTKKISNKPTLISSSTRGPTIYLEFDNRLGRIPSENEISKYTKNKGFDVEIQRQIGVLDVVRDTSRFRIDVWDKGKLSPKKAEELKNFFGGEFSTTAEKLKEKTFISKTTEKGRVGNKVITLKDGTRYESQNSIHALIVNEFNINPDDIKKTSIIVKGGREIDL